jgi:hypothetical protein
LEICRRRLRSISIRQHVVMTMSVALLAAGVVVALSRVPRDLAWFVSGGALALSVATGVWLGIRRTPSLAAVAAAVDRRLGLQDATVTALECIGAADPVSTLVVRNANALTDGIAPATLFTFSLLRYTKPLAVAALAMTVLATMRMSEAGASSNRDGMRVPSGATAAAKSITGGEPASQSASVARTASQSASNIAPSAPQPVAADGSALADRSRASGAHESTQDSTAPQAPETLTRGSAERRDSAGAATQGGAATGAGGAGSGGRGGAGAARDGGRGGSAPGGGDARSAGGVRGQRTGDTIPLTPSTPASESYASRYELAARQAEEALNDGRVPPHLRGYVRRYFNGIRPDRHR